MNTKTIRPCDVTSIYARYNDCCLPDYFQGSSAEDVLAIPVYAGITWKQAYKAAIDEFHRSSGYFDEVEGSETMAVDALRSLFSGKADVDEVADFAKHIEPDPDCIGETVYLYISLHAESDLN